MLHLRAREPGTVVHKRSSASGLVILLASAITTALMAVALGLLAGNWPSREAIDPAAWRQEARWWPLVWLEDPARTLRAGEACVVEARSLANCEALHQRAIAQNSRSTNAALWLAEIAEHAGRNAEAEAWYAIARYRDRSFAPLWAYGNYLWRTGRSSHAVALERELVLRAPPPFRGHLPMLWAGGWTATQALHLLQREGRPTQTLGFVEALSETGDPRAIPAIVYLLREQAKGNTPLVPLGRSIRLVIAQAMDGARPIQDAAKLWSAAVEVGDRRQGGSQSDAIADKRDSPLDDPLWNYNPSVRFPLIPRSFDWSVIQRAEAVAEALPPAAGGIRIALRAGIREPLVLLARTLPIDGEWGSLNLDVNWDGASAVHCPEALFWEFRDAKGAEVLARVRVFPGSDAALGSLGSTSHRLRVDGTKDRLQLMLVYDVPEHGNCPAQNIAIRNVRLKRESIPEVLGEVSEI